MSICLKVVISALAVVIISYFIDVIKTYNIFKKSPIYSSYTNYALAVEAVKNTSILYFSVAPIIIMAIIIVAALVYAFKELFL